MADGRPIIRPSGKGLLPSKVALKNITAVIESMFHYPWVTWGQLKDNEKLSFFNAYRTKVAWRAKHEALVERNFHMKASHRLSNMLRATRLRGQRPSWIGDAVWDALCRHWVTPDFQKKSAQAKKNRASEKGGSLHIGGSVSQAEHCERLARDQYRLRSSTTTLILGRVLARGVRGEDVSGNNIFLHPT